MKFDQDLCLNFGRSELHPRVRCAFGNVLRLADAGLELCFVANSRLRRCEVVTKSLSTGFSTKKLGDL